jgi:hypothetical protein
LGQEVKPGTFIFGSSSGREQRVEARPGIDRRLPPCSRSKFDSPVMRSSGASKRPTLPIYAIRFILGASPTRADFRERAGRD